MRVWMRRFLWALLAAAVVGAIVYAARPALVGVDLAPVTHGTLRVTVDEDGETRIDLRKRYEVSSPLAGWMARVELEPGDPVEAGVTVLTVLEPPEPGFLDARAHAQAEAARNAAEAARDRARAALQEAEEARRRAQLRRERGRAVGARGIAPQELDDLEIEERTAAIRVRLGEFAARVADFELEQAEAALRRTGPPGRSPGEANGGRLEVRSPIDGRVLRVHQRSARVVTAGQPLIEIGDPTDLECVVDVLSPDAVKVGPGTRVLLEHWGGDRPLLGAVRRVEPSGFLKVSALGVEEQRVNVIVDLLDPPEQRPTLGDAFRVEARIIVWEGDVLKVPASALFRHGEGWAVFVAEGGRAVRRAVQVGRNNGLEAEVLAGLAEGEQVVLHPSDKIADGVPIAARTVQSR